MNVIRQIRTAKGYSQRQLARRASLSFKGVQLLEEDQHNWRASSMRKIADAFELPADGIDLIVRRFLEEDADSVRMASIRVATEGFETWKLYLFNYVDAFRATRNELLMRSAPVEELDGRIRGLLASTTEALCAELEVAIPSWCRGVPGLDEPWFVAGVESVKAAALVESPASFRKRNIFVLGNFLDRA